MFQYWDIRIYQNVIYLKYNPRKLNYIVLTFILVLVHTHMQFYIMVVIKQRQFLLTVSSFFFLLQVHAVACCSVWCCWGYSLLYILHFSLWAGERSFLIPKAQIIMFLVSNFFFFILWWWRLIWWSHLFALVPRRPGA